MNILISFIKILMMETLLYQENYLDECGNDGFCLVEDKTLSNYIEKNK